LSVLTFDVNIAPEICATGAVIEGGIMRYRFNDVFHTNPDGTISPRLLVKFNGQIGLPARRLPPVFGGLPIDKHKGEDVEVEDDSDVKIIMGFYPSYF
jgi:hypothetical protein